MSAPGEPLSAPELDLAKMPGLAWEAHVALLLTERLNPALAGNPFWQALRDSAFARFRAVYAAAPVKAKR